MSVRPVDDSTRARARDDFSASLILEAGAGTGKTTLLVDRIESLVRSGLANLDQIAAVTFTENAATTIKLRLRERLERTRADARLPPAESERATLALEALERAPISTIHSLCAAMLAERPVECGVSPGFRVAEEAEADLIFDAAWNEWLDERLTAGDDVLLAALDQDIPLQGEGRFGERASLRGFARALVEQRDLEPLTSPTVADPVGWRAELEQQTAGLPALLSQADDTDLLAKALTVVLQHAQRSRQLAGHELQAHLLALPLVKRSCGQRGKWSSPETLAEARCIAAWATSTRASWEAQAGAHLHATLTRALAQVVACYERKKAERGVLDFLDLLIKTRDALRRRESLRRYFRERFRYVIIDEFQDTDPLQLEIAEILTADEPGKLFVVGDAKQSIYRFRRADAAVFVRLVEAARATPGFAVARLEQNFRSRPAILHFVNRVFGQLIQASHESGQPPYEAIEPRPDLVGGAAVLALRFESELASGLDLLRDEAAALATLLSRVAAGGLAIRDPVSGDTRDSHAGDVMILARRLTQLRTLEEALEAMGLRFVVEGGKSFFDRQEVHEALAVLQAIENPLDRIALVAALRSSFFGTSDRDLVSYVLAGGVLRVGAGEDEKPGADVLTPALELIGQLHGQRRSTSVAALLERLYDETRVLAAHATTHYGAAAIANLEKVVTLARQAQDLGVLTLRGFIELLARRIADAAEEPDLPATRPGATEAVRILSIHKAKGLEAPIVALFDTADDFCAAQDVVPLRQEGKIAIGFRAGCQPPGWAELQKREQARAWAEGRRLLYVACTRARDWLIVPQPSPSAQVGSFLKDLIALTPRESDDEVRVIDAHTATPSWREDASPTYATPDAEVGDALEERWEQERAELIEKASFRAYVPVAATRLAAETAPPPARTEPTQAGRDFGILVHRLLEWTPLDALDRERLSVLAESIASNSALTRETARRAADSVARVLSHPVLQRARRATAVWRELPVWLPEDGRLIEGVVDLVFEEDGVLVVVDYKSDPIHEDEALVQAAHHAPQLRLYGRALTIATGMPVKERLVLFTELNQAVPV